MNGEKNVVRRAASSAGTASAALATVGVVKVAKLVGVEVPWDTATLIGGGLLALFRRFK